MHTYRRCYLPNFTVHEVVLILRRKMARFFLDDDVAIRIILIFENILARLAAYDDFLQTSSYLIVVVGSQLGVAVLLASLV